jgi:hypothetical protein
MPKRDAGLDKIRVAVGGVLGVCMIAFAMF